MTRLERICLSLSLVISALLCVPTAASAMHIMEGYLPPAHCLLWGVICLPWVVAGVFSIRRMLSEHSRVLILLAMSGAFLFVISSLKIPSVTGSCSHMTGTGLAAILFGPAVTSILAMIVLLFQAILLAHGGLTTLGANLFSMAIAGPICSWAIWRIGYKAGWNRKVTIFLAAALGDLFTYCITSVQLALANPSVQGGFSQSMVKFLGVFAPTQLPLAVIEGLLTMLILLGLESYAKPELKLVGFWKEEMRDA